MLKISAVYLAKRKSFIPKKYERSGYFFFQPTDGALMSRFWNKRF
jgi:hypothetical protein